MHTHARERACARACTRTRTHTQTHSTHTHSTCAFALTHVHTRRHRHSHLSHKQYLYCMCSHWQLLILPVNWSRQGNWHKRNQSWSGTLLPCRRRTPCRCKISKLSPFCLHQGGEGKSASETNLSVSAASSWSFDHESAWKYHRGRKLTLAWMCVD